MKLLVQTERITEENLTMMLIRKHDFHDYEGAKYLLEHHANPNEDSGRGWFPMHHALARDNSIKMFALLLDYGAEPTLAKEGLTAIARASREGRNDLLELFEQRGTSIQLHGVDQLIAACAMGDARLVQKITKEEPNLVGELVATGGQLLAKFSGTGNLQGVQQLLYLGVNAAAPFTDGDGYFESPKNSLAIHIAAWRGRPAIVKLLLENGSPVDKPDNNGNTPLALAVKACVNSYWTGRRSPASVAALLSTGVSVAGVPFPSGYAEVDELLKKHQL